MIRCEGISYYLVGGDAGLGPRAFHYREGWWIRIPGVAFLWNFFISREAATAERRYEKERQGVIYMHMAAFSARTNLFSPSPLLALPLPPLTLPPL
jgi:hypothetical protein